MNGILKRIILIEESSSAVMDTDDIEDLFKDANVVLDRNFSPVRLKPREHDNTVYPRPSFMDVVLPNGEHQSVSRNGNNVLIVRAIFDSQQDIDKVRAKSEIKGTYADPEIAIFPDPVGGTDGAPGVNDVKRAIGIDSLKATGKGVKIAIVDTGINGTKDIGGMGRISVSGGWHPSGTDYEIGKAPLGHGTMCAFDARICAPEAQLYDYALILGQNWKGLLSDAIPAFWDLMKLQMMKPGPLVVSNSWGLYSREDDAPVGSPENYSANADHPFNIIVGSLVNSGVDVFFSAGNCGRIAPDLRCLSDIGPGNSIHGANSHPDVITVAAVNLSGKRFEYSSQGPGGLSNQKPDIAAYSEFIGSGYKRTDGGTSASCPLAAGVAAALREKIPNTRMDSYSFKTIILRNAVDIDSTGWNQDIGYGIINGTNLAKYVSVSNNDTR
jgi:subtilisin family serine protease